MIYKVWQTLISKSGIILRVSMGVLILTRILQARAGRKNMGFEISQCKVSIPFPSLKNNMILNKLLIHLQNQNKTESFTESQDKIKPNK